MKELHIGHVMGEGYYVYGDSHRSNITKFKESLEEVLKFARSLASATGSELYEEIQFFTADDMKKVITIDDTNREMAFKIIEQSSRNTGAKFLDKVRNGEETEEPVSAQTVFKYKNGFDFE